MDKYDHAIEFLTEHPEKIYAAWKLPSDYAGRGGELFGGCNKDSLGNFSACLSQVAHSGYEAATPELTAAIRADTRIPRVFSFNSGTAPSVDSLPVFAEWQRRMDIELSRQ